MIPKRIGDANAILGPPAGWDAADGDVNRLHVRKVVHGGIVRFESAWEPTPAELAALNAGGSVVLSVLGAQPPVMLRADHPAPDEPRATTYVIVGGPPSDWERCVVIDDATGNVVAGVLEVDCAAGWLRRYPEPMRVTESGEIAVERIEGHFRIERRAA